MQAYEKIHNMELELARMERVYRKYVKHGAVKAAKELETEIEAFRAVIKFEENFMAVAFDWKEVISMKNYVAYGSNTNISQMKMRCPKAKLLGTGLIEGFRLTFRGNGWGVANIEELSGRTVPVVLWKITRDCEEFLDIYEGYPRLYVKKDVEVINSKGEKIQSFVYVMAEEYTDSPALPSINYLHSIWQGYTENKLNTDTLRKAIAEITEEINEKRYEFFSDRYRENENR